MRSEALMGAHMEIQHDRVPALDAVRGVAILMVVATHSLSATVAVTGSYNFPAPLFRIFAYGEFGVQLFFVLSGWLIFSLYTGHNDFSQRIYWARRWARIWPLWIVFVVATFAFRDNPNPEGNIWLSLAISILFLGWLTPNLFAVPLGGLTIQQEMGHYALFAIFRKRSAAFLAGTVIAGYLSVRLAQNLQQHVNPESVFAIAINGWLRLGLFNTWPFFLLGGLGFALFRMWSTQGLTGLFPDKIKTPALVVVAFLFVGFSIYSQDTPGYFVLGYITFGVLLALAINAIPVVGEMLRSIGRYSYFMYFFHFWVLRWLEDLYRGLDLPGNDQTSVMWNRITLFAIWIGATFISWAVGWVIWRIFEKPILNIARKYVH